MPDLPPGQHPIEGDAYKVRRYRAEWRHDLTGHWTLLGSYAHVEDAGAKAGEAFVDWGGQVRIVEQRVLDAVGLGARDSHTVPSRRVKVPALNQEDR